ncbi:MAG: phosphoribosylglycinamide formyltransferase [Bacteroidaceae bacterium]|nr:phosphoribosylglycinamide formyltransferase [Bacteroidaceae bacterium]
MCCVVLFLLHKHLKYITVKKIAILASGSGSNAENIANYFAGSDYAEVSFIIANNPNAFVLERAKRLGIEAAVVTKAEFMEADGIIAMLQEREIDFVVLAGFLLLVPQKLIQAYPGKIVNIHPALLPKHGGKGMYGDNVHKAVVASGDTESGITIHLIDEHYDKGTTFFQAKCPVLPTDTYEDVAAKVHALEYEHFPHVIEDILRTL